jgi:hypothetical protein
MIKFSQQPVTKQQKIIFPAHDLNLEGYKMKSTFAFKICSTLGSIFEILRKYGTNVLMDVDIYDFLCKSFNGSRLDIQEVLCKCFNGFGYKNKSLPT